MIVGRLNMTRQRLSYQIKVVMACMFLSFVSGIDAQVIAANLDSSEEQTFGPANLLKTMRTPFTTTVAGEDEKSSTSSTTFTLAPIAIQSDIKPVSKNSLQQRFHGPKLFLPAHMVLGQSAEFVIKGNPGSYAAIAMAESNKGAKPVMGHTVRLGADRKLVAIGKIPETGILSVFVEAPIQGDLVGLPLYFEAVIWSNPDFSDLQMASTISAIENNESENGVIVSGQEGKKERAVVFDVLQPMSMKSLGTSNSGKP